MSIDRLVTAAPGTPGFVDGLGRFLSIVLSLNLMLGIFNLFPFPPLDGGAVLAGLVAPVRSFYVKLRAVPAAGFVGVIAAWTISPYVLRPVLLAVREILRS